METLFEFFFFFFFFKYNASLTLNGFHRWIVNTLEYLTHVLIIFLGFLSVNDNISSLLASILHVYCEVRLKMNEKRSL